MDLSRLGYRIEEVAAVVDGITDDDLQHGIDQLWAATSGSQTRVNQAPGARPPHTDAAATELSR